MTKLLRAGPGAVLSYRAAGAQWSLRPSATATADITVPRRRRPIAGVRLHVAALPADECTVLDDFPITTVPRTLLDLAAVLGDAELEAAIGAAEGMGLTDALSLPDLIARYPGRRGVAKLQAALDRLGEGGIRLRLELERRFFLLIAESDLPRPGTNVAIEDYDCDVVWPEARLIVELDSRTHHQRRAAMESDRLRDRRLAVAGWTVIRITWRQIHDDPAGVLADLEALIYTHRSRRRSSVGRALHS